MASSGLFKFGFTKINDNEEEQPSTSAEKRKETKLKYETKRAKRVFRTEWKKTYDGLLYDEEKMVMTCNYCDRSSSRNEQANFCRSGCSSFRVDSLRSHWESSGHHTSYELYMAAERRADRAPAREPGPMDIIIRQLNQQNTVILEKLFNTVYFVLRTEQPFTSLPKLLSLQRKNGSDLEKLKSYDSDNACRRYICVA